MHLAEKMVDPTDKSWNRFLHIIQDWAVVLKKPSVAGIQAYPQHL